MAQFMISAFADEASGKFEEQLSILKEEGISLIELRGVDGKNCADLTASDAEHCRRLMDKSGVRLSALGSPFGKMSIAEPFDAHLAQFRHGLDTCRRLDCDRIRMFSFYLPEGSDPAIWRDEVLRRLEIMLCDAEKAGVLLVHENEKGIYGDTDARCEDLLQHFDGRLGCVFDPANFIQCGVSIPEAYDLLARRITYMHIKDALREDGAVVRAGYGDGHVAEVLSAINRSCKGEMILTVEPHLAVFQGLEHLQAEPLVRHESYPDRRTAFHAACQALRDILNKLEEN